MVFGLDWDLTWIPAAVAALALMGAAIWILWIDFSSRVHRALGLLFLLQSLETGLLVFVGGPRQAWAVAVEGYVLLALPFAAINFGFVYHEAYGARPPRRPQSYAAVRLFLLLVTLGLEVAYFRNHGLIGVSTENPGALFFAIALPNLTYAILSLVFAREFLIAELSTIRRGLALVSTAFALHPAFGYAYQAPGYVRRLAEGTLPPGPLLVVAALIFTTLALLVAVAFVFWRVLRARAPEEAVEDPRRHLAVLGTAATSGLLLGLWGSVSPSALVDARLSLLRLLLAFWEIALPLLLVHSVLRYQFMEADLKAKYAVSRGTVGALILALIFVVSEAPQAMFSSGLAFANPEWGSWLGIGVAGILLFFLNPLARLGHRAAEAALPGVAGLESLSAKERGGLYREQALLAWRDGVLNRKERLLLDQLRKRLGIPISAAAEIESAAVMELGPSRRSAHGFSARRA